MSSQAGQLGTGRVRGVLDAADDPSGRIQNDEDIVRVGVHRTGWDATRFILLEGREEEQDHVWGTSNHMAASRESTHGWYYRLTAVHDLWGCSQRYRISTVLHDQKQEFPLAASLRGYARCLCLTVDRRCSNLTRVLPVV
jgi:hypothetical protein